MITTMYLILFLISVIYLVILLKKFGTSISTYYILLSICIILVNFGLWQQSITRTLEEAFAANRISYLGSSFVAFFMVCSIAELTKTKIPFAIKVIGMGLSVAVFCLGMTIGYSDVYYKSAELVILDNGYSYLEKEYAPLHAIFIIQIVLNMGYGLFMIFRAFFNQKKVSFISSVSSLAVMISVAVVYFVKIDKYSLLPLAYDIGFGIVLYLLNRIYLYDTENMAEAEMKNSKEYGFVTFDSKGRFFDANETARKWFPELNELKIDFSVKNFNTEFLSQVDLWIKEKDKDDIHWFTCEDRIIKGKCSKLMLLTKKKVYCIRLRDDTKQQQYTRLIEHYNHDLEENIALKTKRIEQIQNDITISMASIVENRDSNTGGHIMRTSEVVRVFTGKLEKEISYPEIDGAFADKMIRSAPLHDFGKIAIPDVILNKPGKYTSEEYEIMKKHPVYGADIVDRILKSSEDTAFKTIAKNVAKYHHEKWDGTGYPEGLKGLEIPLEARIMALADVFDALVSKRVYKEKYSFDKAFSIIRESSDSHFDPYLCSLFLECKDELIAVYNGDKEEA